MYPKQTMGQCRQHFSVDIRVPLVPYSLVFGIERCTSRPRHPYRAVLSSPGWPRRWWRGREPNAAGPKAADSRVVIIRTARSTKPPAIAMAEPPAIWEASSARLFAGLVDGFHRWQFDMSHAVRKMTTVTARVSVRIPDFFIVGAPKCGTTAMYQWLQAHPEVFVPVKEIHYFGRDLDHRRPPVSEERWPSWLVCAASTAHRALVMWVCGI